MILGIDIDDTITNTSLVVKKYLQKEYPGYDEYKKLPKKEYMRFLKHNLRKMRREYALKEGVIEAWRYFQQQHFKIIIITARNKKYDKDNFRNTILFLKQQGLNYDKIYFKAKKKGKIAFREHVDLFIDDKEAILDQMALYGIKGICMGHSSKYPSFDNWSQVIDYVKEEYYEKRKNIRC